MAMSMEYSFSIREYAARMRSVDVVKCWPFEEADDETVKSMLPPITIKKFRWWFDELELVRSNCAHYGKRSKKKLQELGEISHLESENIESMRMKRFEMIKPAKGKLKFKNKPPRKRSIVELFAVSPQVDRVNSDNEEDDDDNSYYEEDSDNDSVQEGGLSNSTQFAVGNAGSKCKNKRKVKKKGISSMLDKQKKVVRSLKKKFKKTRKMEKDTALVVRNAKKEKSSRLKLISSVGPVAVPKCSTNDTGVVGEISSFKKEPTLKCLASEKKSKTLKTSNLRGKNKKLVLPVHGILKNRKKVFPMKKSTCSISQDAGKVNKCNTRHVNKQVTFSINDDVHGARRNKNSTAALEMEKFCYLSSDVTGAPEVNDHTAEREEGPTIHQMVEVEEENDFQENEINVQPVTGMHFSIKSHDSDAPIFHMHHVSCPENFFNKPVALGPVALHYENLQSLEGCSRGKSHDALYTCSTLPMTQDDRIPRLASPVFGHLSDASSSNGSFSGSFTDFLKAYPQPSTSCKSILNENANCRLHLPSQVTQQNYYDCSLQYPWFPHLSPKELMRTICSFPDWNSRMAVSGETSINEDLVGLPLNSQGELIRLNSNVNGRFDHLRDTSTILNPSTFSPMHNDVLPNFVFDQAYLRSWNGMTSPADKFRMYRSEDFRREMESLPISSRLDPMEQNYGARRTIIMPAGHDPSFCALDSEMDLAKMLCNRSRQDQLVHKHSGNPNHVSLQFSQSTMRLMGKEFKIGGTELQELEDREVWMGKEATKEQYASAATEGPCIRCHDLPEFAVRPISAKLKNTVIQLSEAEVNSALGSVSHVMVPESRILSQFLQSQDNVIPQDGYGIGKCNMIPEILPHFSLAASRLPGSGRTVCQDPLFCGYDSPTASETLVPSFLFQDTSQSMSSCIGLRNMQKPPNPSNLALNLPHLDKECGSHVQQSWSQNPFRVMTPWWLDSRQKGTLNDYNQTYPSPASSCSGIDHQIEPSVCPNSEPFYVFPDATLQNSLASSSLVPCQLLPLQDSLSQNRYREKMKFENCVKSRVGIRIPNPGRSRSKKRLAPASDAVAKLTKMPKLRMQEDSTNTVTALKTIPIFEPDVRCNREVLESASAKNTANNMECSKISAHKDEFKVGCGMAFDKLQGAPRSGPIRLTPGAKYLLKPCQNKEQMPSKPSHSSIPFEDMASEDGVRASEKSAKIYRF